MSITNQATIKINIDVDDAKLKGLKDAFENIAQAFDLKGASDRFSTLDKVVSDLTSRLSKLEKASTGASTKINAVSTAASKAATAQEKESKAAQTAANIAARAGAARSKLVALDSKYGGVLKRNEGLYKGLGNVIGMTERQIQNYERAVEEVIAAEKERNRLMKGGGIAGFKARASEYEKNVDAIFRASYRLQMVGANLKSWARDVFTVGKQLIDTFAEFQFTTNRAAGAMQIFQNSEIAGAATTHDLQNAILDSADALNLFDPQDVAQATYFWGSTTGQVVKTLDDLKSTMLAVNPIMKLAALTDTEYEASIKGVYSILTQYFGGAIENTQQVVEQLFYTTQRTAAELPDLINSFKMVGPVAHAVGASFSDINDLLGEFADLGIRGTMAGRALRQFFIQTLRPSGPATEALKDVFGSLEEYNRLTFPGGKFVGFTKYVQNLADATFDLSVAERDALLARISTANELPILIAAMSKYRAAQAGVSAAGQKVIDSQKEAAKYFADNWNQLSNSAKAMVGDVQVALKSLSIVIGGQLAAAVAPFAKKIAEIVNAIRRWVDANPDLVQSIAKVIAVVGGAAGIAGVLFTATGALLGLGAAVYYVINVFGPLASVFAGATTIVTAFSTAFTQKFDQVQSTVKRFVDDITSGLEGLGSYIDSFFSGFEEVVSVMTKVMGIFIDVFDAALTALGEAFKSVSDTMNGFSKDANTLNDLLHVLGAVIGSFLVAKFILLVASMAQAAKGAALFALRLTGIGKAATVAAAGEAELNVASKTLTGRIGGMIGGPLGLIVLGTTLASLAYETFPAVKDAVDGLIGSFKDYTGAVNDFQRASGKNGLIIVKSLRDEVRSRLALQKVIRQSSIVRAAPVTDASGYAQEQVLARTMPDFVGTVEESLKRQDSARKIGQITDKEVEAILAAVNQSWKDMNERRAANYLGEIVGSKLHEVWAKAIDFGMGVMIGESGGPMMGDSKIVAQTLIGLFENMPPMRTEDVQKAFDKYIIGSHITGISYGEFYQLALGMDKIGNIAVDNKELSDQMTYIMDNMTQWSADTLKSELLKSIGGKEFISWMYDPTITSLMQDSFTHVYDYYIQLLQQSAENATGTSKDYADALSSTLENTIEEGFLKAVPNIADIVAGIQGQLEIGGTDAMNAIIEALLPLAPLIHDNKMSSDLASALTEVGKYAIENGANDRGFLDAIGKAASDAGRTAASRSDLWGAFVDSIMSPNEMAKQMREAIKGKGVQKGLDSLKFFTSRIFKKLSRRGQAGRMAGRDLLKSQFGAKIGVAATRRDDSEGQKRIIQSIIGKNRGLLPRDQKILADLIFPNLSSFGPSVQKLIAKKLPIIRKMIADAARAAEESAPKPFEGSVFQNLGNMAPPDPSKILPTKPDTQLSTSVGLNAAGRVAGLKAGVTVPAKVKPEWSLDPSSDPLDVWMSKQIPATPIPLTATYDITPAMTAASANGETIGGKYVSGIESGIDTNIAIATGAASGAVGNMVSGLATGAWNGGVSIGASYIMGITKGMSDHMQALITEVALAKAFMWDNSPPKKGPLKGTGKGGESVGRAYMQGISTGINDGAKGLHNSLKDQGLSFLTGQGHAEMKVSHKKELTVKIEVTSPDKSIDRVKKSQLRRAVMDALTMGDIEHYATIG